MKKLIISLVATWFLASVAGPVFAAEPTPMATPAAKAMKHKAMGHKTGHKKMKKGKKSKKTATPSTTPTAK